MGEDPAEHNGYRGEPAFDKDRQLAATAIFRLGECYRKLGQTGISVSPLCLGAMTFGDADNTSFMHNATMDMATSHAVLDRAVERGVNIIDTADVYGQDGLSERVLGDWLAARSIRDKLVIATKFRFTMGDGPNKSGASRYRITKCCDDSLRRLKTDRSIIADLPDKTEVKAFCHLTK